MRLNTTRSRVPHISTSSTPIPISFRSMVSHIEFHTTVFKTCLTNVRQTTLNTIRSQSRRSTKRVPNFSQFCYKGLYKICSKNCDFQILDFCRFLFVFVDMWGQMSVDVSTISCLKVHIRLTPQNSYTPRDCLYESLVKEL